MRKKMISKKRHWLLYLLPILGIAFWFLLAFPMADRNESYIWITYLQKYSFAEIIQNAIPSVRSFRPLAQAATWCLYHLSGANGILIQFFNFAALCAAIWIMITLSPPHRSIYARISYLVMCAVYFPAFYYIFNLHGIFYSVILLVIALFLKAGEQVLTHWKKWFLISIVLAFFHPFILILYVAYLTGWLIEKKQLDRNRLVLLASIVVVLFLLLQLLLPFPIFSVIDIRNLIGTLRNVETYNIIRLFTLLLCVLMLVNTPRRHKRLISVFIVVYVALALAFDLPFLLLLGFLVIASLAIEGKWSLAGLVVAAISFPLAVGSGAPTKASIFIFLLPCVLVRFSSPSFVPGLRITKVTTLALLMIIVSCAVLIRLEVKVPLLSGLVRPLLVERGKTLQLARALELAEQQSPDRRIVFLQEKQGNIRDKGQPTRRDDFPPTKQNELDIYQDYRLSDTRGNTASIWYLAFGTPFANDTLTLVQTLREENCKPAYIYERLPPPE